MRIVHIAIAVVVVAFLLYDGHAHWLVDRASRDNASCVDTADCGTGGPVICSQPFVDMCQKTCGLCHNNTTVQVSECVDIANCSDTYNKMICDEPEMSVLCKKTCGLCATATGPSATATPSLVTQSSSIKTTGSSAPTLHSLNTTVSTPVMTTVQDPCQDVVPEGCTSVLDQTHFQRLCNDQHMALFCNKSCGLCNVGSQTPKTTVPTMTTTAVADTTTVPTTSTTTVAQTTATTTTSKPAASTTTTAVPSKTTTTTTPTPTTTTSATTTTVVTTTTPIATTTTTKATTVITTTVGAALHTPAVSHDNAMSCVVCDLEPEYCEMLYVPMVCDPPNNYCINYIENHKDGSRMVNRTCGNFDTCYRDWYEGSSDKEYCQNFREDSVFTHNFECTFCCVEDDCNTPLKPTDRTLYREV